METRTIHIRVSDAAARAYERASEQERQKLDALLDLKLTEATGPRRSLEEIIRDMSRQAEANALTPEALEDILRSPEE